MPYANSYAMQIHLEEISRHVPEGRHAVVIFNKAGRHTSKGLKIPHNISLLSLPPYSPEMNPQEQIGRQMKHNDLANKLSRDY